MQRPVRRLVASPREKMMGACTERGDGSEEGGASDGFRRCTRCEMHRTGAWPDVGTEGGGDVRNSLRLYPVSNLLGWQDHSL